MFFGESFWLCLTTSALPAFTFGILLGSFSNVFLISYFGDVLKTFVLEKCKDSKTEDVAPDLYITVFREGRMIWNSTRNFENQHFFHWFLHQKTNQNRLKNVLRRWVQWKWMKTQSLGTLFGVMGWFLAVWGVSKGTPKLQTNDPELPN